MTTNDHDLLIALNAQFEILSKTVNRNASDAAERDGRLESKVDRINGSIGKLEDRTLQLEGRPIMPITREEALVLVDQTREMWPAYKAARWVMALVVTAFVGQSIAAVITAIWFVIKS